MLIYTLVMHSFSTLGYIAVFLIQCRAIVVRDDDYDATPKTYAYPDSEIARSEIGYRHEDYYKPLRINIGTDQYISDENSHHQEADYTRQQSDQDAENYPFTQRGHRQQTARRRTPAKKLHVEQYLKEVPPTTKTTYNQRSGNYLRLNSQPHDRDIKEQTELQRSILKQPSIQYIVQSDLQQKSETHPQVQYVIPDKAALRSSNQQPNSATLTVYQNALLAHQKVLETEAQDETSSTSSIYVSHSIPKKPVRKIVKPADDDTEQYTQLQQYQIQKQPVYELRQPAEVMYQGRKLEYSSRDDTDFPSDTKLSKYEHEKELVKQRLLQLSQYQQISTEEPLHQEEKVIYQQPQQLSRYQQLLASRQSKIPQSINKQPQISPETSYQRPVETLEYKTPSRVEEPGSVQYRQPIFAKKGPKYLPEPNTGRYQVDESEEKYQNIPNQHPEALISFEAAIAKLESDKLKARQQRPQTTYQQEQAYRLLTGEIQDANLPETEYVKIGEPNKYHSVDNVAPSSYRQPHQNGNIRYYRRSDVSYSHQQ